MSKLPDDLFYDAVKEQSFGDNKCFLCGINLNNSNRSDEHIIPRWIQKRYNIYNKNMHLLNGTSIAYRKLTVPCCYNCNNIYLQPLESRMSQAVLNGPNEVIKLGWHDIFVWLGKMFYGLLYKELFLKSDITNPNSTTITSQDLLDEFRMHHIFLQSIRIPMLFSEFMPCSLLVFETHSPNRPEYQWDFRDSIESMFISCRMGKVGIVATLQDGGAQNDYFPLLRIERRKLHPIQYLEVVSKVLYRSSLFNRVPKYLLMGTSPITVIQSPLVGFSTKPIFDDWYQSEYARFFSGVTGLPLERIYQPPNRVASYLRDNEGKALRLDFRVQPWPPLKP